MPESRSRVRAEPEAEPQPEPQPEPLVRCRWLHPEPALVKDPALTVVCYGDEVHLAREQADDPRTPAVPWDDDWTPDPDLAALAAAAEAGDPI